MELEALKAILMDDIKEIDPADSGLNATKQCFQIIISSQREDNADDSSIPVELALIFAHSEKYPDEPPFLNVRSLRGIKLEDLKSLNEKLDKEASENLGMAMVYTLLTSAKEWLIENYGGDSQADDLEEKDTEKDEIIVPHGEPVTVDTFLAWRERFEAELALQRARLMPDTAITVSKEKKITGRQWFESGRAAAKGAALVTEDSEEEDEDDIDFDDDFEDDEEDMLEHYLAEKSEGSSHGGQR